MKIICIQRKSHDDEIVFALTTITESFNKGRINSQGISSSHFEKNRAKSGIFGQTAKFGPAALLVSWFNYWNKK